MPSKLIRRATSDVSSDILSSLSGSAVEWVIGGSMRGVGEEQWSGSGVIGFDIVAPTLTTLVHSIGSTSAVIESRQLLGFLRSAVVSYLVFLRSLAISVMRYGLLRKSKSWKADPSLETAGAG